MTSTPGAGETSPSVPRGALLGQRRPLIVAIAISLVLVTVWFGPRVVGVPVFQQMGFETGLTTPLPKGTVLRLNLFQPRNNLAVPVCLESARPVDVDPGLRFVGAKVYDLTTAHSGPPVTERDNEFGLNAQPTRPVSGFCIAPGRETLEHIVLEFVIESDAPALHARGVRLDYSVGPLKSWQDFPVELALWRALGRSLARESADGTPSTALVTGGNGAHRLVNRTAGGGIRVEGHHLG